MSSPVATLLLACIAIVGPAAREAGAVEDLSTMRGANYVPSYARNDVSIWMDYDHAVVDRELGFAEKLKLNTVRVFLNQLVYEHDPRAMVERFDDFLGLCEKHHLRAMPVLFDSCFGDAPVLKDYRNKAWMASPGFSRLGKRDRPAMEAYIQAIVGSHKDDQRIVLWDVVNEPESTPQYGDLAGGRQTIDDFVRWSLMRVRSEKPAQPLTIGWAVSGNNIATIDLVDVICVHLYCPWQDLTRQIQECQNWGRIQGKQVILNEFVGQPHQAVDAAIPIAVKEKIGWVFWELMIGKTQFTAGSAPYQGQIYPDGACRSAREVAAIVHPEGASGNLQAIAADAGFQVRTFSAEGMRFEGGWQRWEGQGPKGNRLWHAGNPDDAVSKSVTGSKVVVILKHGPDCGIVTVTIDGKPARLSEIDTFSKEVDWNHPSVVSDSLPAGNHEVILAATGRKAGASSFRFIQVVNILAEP